MRYPLLGKLQTDLEYEFLDVATTPDNNKIVILAFSMESTYRVGLSAMVKVLRRYMNLSLKEVVDLINPLRYENKSISVEPVDPTKIDNFRQDLKWVGCTLQ